MSILSKVPKGVNTYGIMGRCSGILEGLPS